MSTPRVLFLPFIALVAFAGLTVSAAPAVATFCTPETPQFCDTTTTTTTTTLPPPITVVASTTTTVPPTTTVPTVNPCEADGSCDHIRGSHPATGWKRDAAVFGLELVAVGLLLVVVSHLRFGRR